MSMHLNKDELTLIIEKSPQHLSTNRFLHFEKCNNCRKLYKQQIGVHNALLNIAPIKAPASILGNVVKAMGEIPSKMPTKKTDWMFLFALITLFGIGAWFIFSGSLGESIGQYLPQIVTETESTKIVSEFFKPYKDSIGNINFTFELFKMNGHRLYLFFGFLSFFFYMFLDKKFGHSIKLNRP